MELFIAIFLFAIPLSITPGPNNIMLMMSGLNYGIKKSIPHYLGILLGFPIMIFILGFGFGTLLAKFPLFHHVIKVVGAAYMLYLAWKIATANTQLEGKQISTPFKFHQAFLFQWVNPKAWVMGIGTISAFTTIGGNIPFEVAEISAAFLLACIPCTGAWLLFSLPLKNLFKNQRQQKYFNYSMGILLALSIVMLLLD